MTSRGSDAAAAAPSAAASAAGGGDAAAQLELAQLQLEEATAAHKEEIRGLRAEWELERDVCAQKIRAARLATDAMEAKLHDAEARTTQEKDTCNAVVARHVADLTKSREEIEKLKTVKAALETREHVLKEKYAASVDLCEQHKRDIEKKQHALDRQEADHVSMITTLSSQIELLKKDGASKGKELEKAQTTNSKDALLHKLFQEQIENTTFDLTQTRGQLDFANKERGELAEQMAGVEDRLRATETARDEKYRTFEAEIRALGREKDELATKLAAEEVKSKDFAFELENLKERYFEHLTEGKRRDTQNHRAETDLKAEVKKLAELKETLKADQERDAYEAKMQIQKLREENTSLNATVDAVRQAHREADAAATKRRIELEKERDELQFKHAQVYGQVNASQADTSQKMSTLQKDVDRLEEALAAAVQANEELGAANAREVASLEARLDTAHRQITDLRAEAAQQKLQHQDSTLVTWHEREGFKRSAADKETECEKLRDELANYKMQVGTELTMARRREHDIMVDNRASVAALEAKAFKLQAELTLITGNYDAAIDARAAAEKTLDDKSSEHAAIVASLKTEIGDYQTMVKKLEGEVIANYDKKALAAQNEELKETVQMFRNKISSLEHTIASIKIEADIMESRKTKALQESNTQCIGRILQLQNELDTQQQLLCNIVPFAAADAFPPATLRSLQAFVRRHEDSELGKLLSSHQALALAIDGSPPQPKRVVAPKAAT